MYYLILFFILTILTYSIILVVKGEKIRLFKRSSVTFISKYLDELNKRNIIVKINSIRDIIKPNYNLTV